MSSNATTNIPKAPTAAEAKTAGKAGGSPAKGAPGGSGPKAGGPKSNPPMVQVTTSQERARYRSVLQGTLSPGSADAGDIIAYSGVDDPGHNQVRDRPAKVDFGIQSANVIHHSDMNSDVMTTAKALNIVWVRIHGVGSQMSAGTETYFAENRVTHSIKSLQTWLIRQGARDMQLHWTVPFKLDSLPDAYTNGTTQKKSHSHSASDSITAKGKLVCTTSRPGGQDKRYVNKLFENINDPNDEGNRPHDLYVKVLEFVVTVDENAKFGATAKQAEAVGLLLSCMMKEEFNPSGKPSTAPDIFVESTTFIPNKWPSIVPPTGSVANVGEIKLTSPTIGPDLIPSRQMVLGGKLDRSLRLNENYVYTISASIFGIVHEGAVLCPRYAFAKDGYVYFALNEKDAMEGRAVSAPGAVIPHATTFRPMFPRTGAFGAKAGEYAGGALPFAMIAQLVN